MKLEVQRTPTRFRGKPVRLPLARLKIVGRTVLKKYGSAKSPHDVSLVFMDDASIRVLNREWRGVDRATDVLSFDYGEIIISLETAQRQAKTHEVTVADEITLLFVHGLLHILGFDHERPKDRATMMTMETAILGMSGLVGKVHEGSGKSSRKSKKKTV